MGNYSTFDAYLAEFMRKHGYVGSLATPERAIGVRVVQRLICLAVQENSSEPECTFVNMGEAEFVDWLRAEGSSDGVQLSDGCVPYSVAINAIKRAIGKELE
jgi:hypothetical protein